MTSDTGHFFENPILNSLNQYPAPHWELVFTNNFKDGLEKLPKEIYQILERQLAWIKVDPYAKNPQATRIKNARNVFRVRIGIHIRMLYRIISKEKRIELSSIGTRESIYKKGSGGRLLSSDETAAILTEIHGSPRITLPETGVGQPQSPPQSIPDLPVSVEAVEWITEDELFLLHVPSDAWPAILQAGSIEGIEGRKINDSVREQIEDYWTNPQHTQVEKLYSLSSIQGIKTIAQQPLSHFLIALDPEQKQALQKIKSDGPYLIKGSAGTGKSLVGLYHIRDLVITRAGESLFDEEKPLFGVVTFTNTLVSANQTLLKSITPVSAHAGIRCSTLDKLAYDLTEKALGRKPNALNTEGISKWLRERVVPELSSAIKNLAETLGYEYIAEEIEQVIIGNGLTKEDDYLKQERKGRKRGLRETERTAIWTIYEKFMQYCERDKTQTFEQWRLIALQYLRSHRDHERFTVLFVDEAQDFSKVARQFCLALVKDPKNLVLAADTGQSIYTVPASWRQTDERFNFQRRRPITLERSYRATREIGKAISPLRLDPGDEYDMSGDAYPVISGPKPKWISVPRNKHAEKICEEILRLSRDGHHVNYGQIAIIVRDSNGASLHQTVLKSKKINSVIVDKKLPLNIDGDHVHIITAHSSKGLGFPIVFVPHLHEDAYPWRLATSKAKDAQQLEQIIENEQRLLYVAFSRASYRLFILEDSDHPSPFLKKLNREDWV